MHIQSDHYLTEGVSVGLSLVAGLSWDKTGRDVPSQTTLPATHTLGPHDNRTHEAGSLDAGSVCSAL